MAARTPAIVAVGASAGGLEALEQFFSAVPENTGLAFVVIQHLSPDFKSVMDDLLARRTAIPIRQATEGGLIEPDTIYLNPSKTDLRIEDGRFATTPQDHLRQIPLPIDAFMTSLAITARRTTDRAPSRSSSTSCARPPAWTSSSTGRAR